MERHTTVFLTEGVDALAIKPNGTYVDATLGAHGHAHKIIDQLGKMGTFVGIDADSDAIHSAYHDLTGNCTITLVEGNFRNINSLLNCHNIQKVDGILADLGWRTEQFSGNGKGFSFQVDEPLVMTYGDPSHYTFTASQIVNEWDEENIASILEGYGEERYAKRIARAIVTTRDEAKIKTTFDLKKIVESVVPRGYLHGKINPSTRTFQALRIAVNDELGALEELLFKGFELLRSKGRLAVITFHSLEDRIVKQTFRSLVHDQRALLVAKKPILPQRKEVVANRRARSAKLRILEKI